MKRMLAFFVLLAIVFCCTSCDKNKPAVIDSDPFLIPALPDIDVPRMSYEEYFFEERLFVWETDHTNPYDWDFNENGILSCAVNGKRVVITENATVYWGSKNEVFYVENGYALCYIKSNGKNQKLLLESDAEILGVVGDSDIVCFYDDTGMIYRYHLESGKLDEMTKPRDDIFVIRIYSNFCILWSVYIHERIPDPMGADEYLDSYLEWYMYDSRTAETTKAPESAIPI